MNRSGRGPVLVTGASSGIGGCVVRYLADRGHDVFGTVRNDSDADTLREIPHVTPLRVDVTIPAQIEAAVVAVTDAGAGLYGLVNNAGVGGLGMLSTWDDAGLRHIFDVNVFGPHRMTNAFLPLLLASNGRIVTIGSRGGMLTKAYYGPYTMTKHAIEAYAETLRDELAPYGVFASVIQPGGVPTGIAEASRSGTLARFRRAKPPFVNEASRACEMLAARRTESGGGEADAPDRRFSPPEGVAEAVYDALFAETPRLRYLVCTKSEGAELVDGLIDRLLDENDSCALGHSRDDLVAILDRRLAARRDARGTGDG